jgi:hypothetical protein
MSLAEMRKELREMRKDLVKPVSRMKKGDISHEIEALRQRRETTPAPAATPSAPPKGMKPDVENIKDVKKSVFMKPKAEKMPAKAEKMPAKAAKSSKKDMLMKMLAELDD